MVKTEHQEQVAFIEWCRIMALSRRHPELAYIFAVPNGANISKRERYKLTSEGLLRGVADLLLLVPRRGYNGLIIEMKREKGGRLSQYQKDFIAFQEKQNYYCCVPKGCIEAIEKTTWYLAE